MNQCVVFVVLALTHQLHTILAEGYQHGSAQYLYMERLRKNTPTFEENEPTGEDNEIPGTLLATSLKDTCKYNRS